ncbi:MAG TPA: DUF4129 domain-containing protein [Candidatus Dormibacteraeota bacterium]|jgi:hypothetical protein|nr:DUF4129 domain-containing protein [Candidatus Dormibacteraeota bacterium]
MMAFGRRYWPAVMFLLAGLGQASERPSFTTTQYVVQLQIWENQIVELASAPQKAVALRDSLPAVLTVQTTRGDMAVDLGFLRDALNRYLTATAEAKPSILTNASRRLKATRAEAELYEQPGRVDDPMRKRLDKILSAREFDRVRGPSPLDLLKQRILAWISKLFKKISPKVPDIQDLGQVFVWGMIALAAAIAGVWLYRVSQQNAGFGKREIVPFLPSARNWREWLADARARAAQGEWRDAVHFGFWAAVSRLESESVWPPDKTRTPREYLNAIPASSSSKEPFAAMTRKFEASWYGSRPTTEADFAQFTAHLESLGCR